MPRTSIKTATSIPTECTLPSRPSLRPSQRRGTRHQDAYCMSHRRGSRQLARRKYGARAMDSPVSTRSSQSHAGARKATGESDKRSADDRGPGGEPACQ
ncbi:hypothetical protein RJ55_02810 [Drechmeria coniospora]|nr:hypothetical protein RJ55_02810 [Drechmeria coniospora]